MVLLAVLAGASAYINRMLTRIGCLFSTPGDGSCALARLCAATQRAAAAALRDSALLVRVWRSRQTFLHWSPMLEDAVKPVVWPCQPAMQPWHLTVPVRNAAIDRRRRAAGVGCAQPEAASHPVVQRGARRLHRPHHTAARDNTVCARQSGACRTWRARGIPASNRPVQPGAAADIPQHLSPDPAVAGVLGAVLQGDGPAQVRGMAGAVRARAGAVGGLQPLVHSAGAGAVSWCWCSQLACACASRCGLQQSHSMGLGPVLPLWMEITVRAVPIRSL